MTVRSSSLIQPALMHPPSERRYHQPELPFTGGRTG
jgi:hypothetical protein